MTITVSAKAQAHRTKLACVFEALLIFGLNFQGNDGACSGSPLITLCLTIHGKHKHILNQTSCFCGTMGTQTRETRGSRAREVSDHIDAMAWLHKAVDATSFAHLKADRPMAKANTLHQACCGSHGSKLAKQYRFTSLQACVEHSPFDSCGIKHCAFG
jgi:hypothetical protein